MTRRYEMAKDYMYEKEMKKYEGKIRGIET
jgi:hypothetical protein